MTYPSKTYSFVAGNTISAAQLNQNFNDIINGISDGTKDNNILNSTINGSIISPSSNDATVSPINGLTTTNKTNIRLTNAGVTTLNGISNGSSGKIVNILNCTGYNLTISNNSASASAGDKIYTGNGNSVVIPNNGYVSFIYDSTSSYWRMTGLNNDEILVQDYTTISSVGTASQQAAGHIWDSNEGGITDLAYYKFANGSMTTDQTSTYTLTDPGGANSPTNSNGITGSDYCAYFDGGDYYTQATLLDVVPAAIAIDFWFKASDGQPAATNYIFNKTNDETGGTRDYLNINIQTSGILSIPTRANETLSILSSSTILPNGQTGWYYVAFNWDTTNGKRLWINGILESQDSTATTLFSNGTTRDFIIGATNSGGAIADYLTGSIALFRIRNAILTQKDVDLGYSVKYSMPSLMNYQTAQIKTIVKEDGSDYFISEYKGNIEVMRTSSYFYFYGNTLSSTDKLMIVVKQ